MTKIEKIRALQVMGYSPEMIAAEVGCGIAYVLSHLHTPKDYSERNMVRKMYSGGKSTIEINRATGLKFCIIANHLRTPRVIIERRDVGNGRKDYFYTFKHLRKYLPGLSRIKYNSIKNKEKVYRGYMIKEIKPEIINYDFAD